MDILKRQNLPGSLPAMERKRGRDGPGSRKNRDEPGRNKFKKCDQDSVIGRGGHERWPPGLSMIIDQRGGL